MSDTTIFGRAALDRLSALEIALSGSASVSADITNFEKAVLARIAALEIQKFGKVTVEPDTTSFTAAVLARLSALDSGIVSLSGLSLSSTVFTVGTPSSGTINGATVGSTITASGLPTGVTINSAARTWAYDGSGTASTGSLTLTETLAGATNTPHNSTINYTVNSGLLSVGTLAFDSANGWVTGQNPPALAVGLPSDGSVQVGDWYCIAYGSSSSLAGATYAPWQQITSDMVLNDTVGETYAWGVASLPGGLTYFACQFGRGADATHIVLTSPLSNIINDTLVAVGATTILDAANTETHVTVATGTFGASLRLYNGVDGGFQCSRTTKQVLDGSKVYCEMTITALHASGHIMLGITDGTFSFPASFGSSPTGSGKGAGLNGNGLIYPSTSGLGAAQAAGGIVQCCVKRTGTAIRLWIGYSGAWVGDPSAETGGESYTLGDTNCYGFTGVTESVDEVDVNFGQSAFTYSKPTGATAWQ